MPDSENTQSKSSGSFLMRSAGSTCLYFFILSLTSSLTYLHHSKALSTIMLIIAISILAAYISSMICESVARHRSIHRIAVVLFAVIFNVMIILDYFMMINFGCIFGQDAVDIVLDTNPKESYEFLSTYLTIPKIALWIAAIALYNLIAWKVCKLLQTRYISYAILAITVCGLGVCGSCVAHYVRYGSGMSIPQCNSIVRAAYAFYVGNKSISIHYDILDKCKSAPVDHIGSGHPDIAVIIGESHSTGHSQLYGYDKPTEPEMSRELADSGMILYKDAVSPWDLTLRAMQTAFSIAGAAQGLTDAPLFPALFRKAGYRTVMLDNQYTVGNGITVLADKGLSDIMFDERNDAAYRYDSEMISTITLSERPTLYVIHLIGQHYEYADRCPADERVFKESDYPGSLTKEQRETLAHYDNATLATDRNLHGIIDRFRDRDCAVIYFSDHGEELYEGGKEMGHGFAAQSSDPARQLRVPLWIWLSPKYRQNRPDVAQAALASATRRVTTNDASQTILELGQISTPLFDPSRSIISPHFDESRPRTVLSTLDFDKMK